MFFYSKLRWKKKTFEKLASALVNKNGKYIYIKYKIITYKKNGKEKLYIDLNIA